MRRPQIEIQNGIPVLTTTQVGERLGMKPSVGDLLALGIEPVQRTALGCYWALSDMPSIRIAAAKRVLQVQPDEVNQ
ncbi:hypothetical protein [Achromobacter insuavis]|uniref:hypothetical protein n=1 Tax=Achromobacter insuavis TaxID=1287735 RepID=UPI000A51579D|nr:hypothetical protein [Achromobacter insuavis]